MRSFLISALLAGATLVGTQAQAATFGLGDSLSDNANKIFLVSPPPVDSDHPDSDETVYGRTNQGAGDLIRFTGNTDLTATGESGYATIKGASGWNTLTIEPDLNAFGFTALDFSVMLNGKGSITVDIYFLDGTSPVQFTSSSFNGNTDFTVLAGAGEILKSITVSGDLKQVKQLDIALVPAPVPEPATWAMMIAGLGLAGAMLRRRATKVQFA